MMKKLLIAALAALTVTAAGTAGYSVFHATPAYAANAKAVVDQAIAAGRIGERIDGYLAAVTDLNDAERRAMNEINIGRKTVYTDLAEKKGVSVEVIGRLSGEKQIGKAAAGSMIMTDSGQWSKK
jgi:uncharacterized protein YdbL (DUF1318 family)